MNGNAQVTHTPNMVQPCNGEPYGPNAMQIRAQATRVIKGPMMREVRNELMQAVKLGGLGRLKKDGLKPEVFYHPDHKNGAIERQNREAIYSVQCIASVVVSPADFRDGLAAAGVDVEQFLLARAAIASATGAQS